MHGGSGGYQELKRKPHDDVYLWMLLRGNIMCWLLQFQRRVPRSAFCVFSFADADVPLAISKLI
jgi:hypothetical protein